MNAAIARLFLILLWVAAIVWIAGMITGLVVPLFGGVEATKVREVLFAVGIAGELCCYLLALFLGRIGPQSPDPSSGIGSPGETPKHQANPKT